MRGKGSLLSLGSVVVMITTVGVMIGACSATPTGSFSTEGAGASNNTGGNGSGGSGNTGNNGEGGGFIPGTSSSGGLGGGSCAATVVQGEQVPLGMYLMIDKSGSMAGANWANVTNALKAFVDQPSAAGIGVGLEYFPPSCPEICNTNADCGACGPCDKPFPFFPGSCQGGDSCDVNEYQTPSVVIANLPGIAPVIKSSLDATTPDGGTPTSASLDGAIGYTRQWMMANANAVGVVVFATDGEPSECDTNLMNIYNIAAAGLNGMPSVKTFVIGVGSSLTSLNGIAAAGGTGQAFLVDAGGNAQQEFLNAMNAIRGQALSCAYLIPTPPAGETIDYNAINVQYTPEVGMPEVIPQVSSQAGCPTDGTKAWYYDNQTPPQQILLCSSTCDQISGDAKGKVDVLVGCETILK
jgi:hypothetical protein